MCSSKRPFGVHLTQNYWSLRQFRFSLSRSLDLFRLQGKGSRPLFCGPFSKNTIGKKLTQARRKLVSHMAERRDFFFRSACSAAWIPDAPMNALGGSGKSRTFVSGRITNRNDRVEPLSFELRNWLGPVCRDVDPDLTHGFNRQRADVAVRLAPRAVHFVSAPAKLAQKSFRHLTAHAIAGAKDENAMGHDFGLGQ